MSINSADVTLRLASLGYTATAADDLAVAYAIGGAEQWIKNNINRVEVPDDLRFIWIDMAAGMFLADKRAAEGLSGGTGGGAQSGVVASIKEGDTTVTYATGGAAADSSPEARLDALIDSLVNPPQEQLAAFRRMRWTP
jgi:hypothetical protein